MNREPHYRVQEFESRVPAPKDIKRTVDLLERRMLDRHVETVRELTPEQFARRWKQAQENRTR